MLEYQNDLVELGKFYAERLVFQSITSRAYSLTEQDNAPSSLAQIIPVMQALATSFGVERILRNPSWFFEQQHLNAQTLHSARLTLNHTYATIADHSFDLCQAFGIPEQSITAPIAQ